MVSKRLPKAFKYCLTKFVVKAQLHFQEMELIKKLMNEHDLHFPSNNLIKKKHNHGISKEFFDKH